MVHCTPCFSFWVVKNATWILLDALTLVSHRTVQCGGENCPLMDLSKVNLRLNIATIQGRVERTFKKRAGYWPAVNIQLFCSNKVSSVDDRLCVGGSHFNWLVVMAYLSLPESIGWQPYLSLIVCLFFNPVQQSTAHWRSAQPGPSCMIMPHPNNCVLVLLSSSSPPQNYG